MSTRRSSAVDDRFVTVHLCFPPKDGGAVQRAAMPVVRTFVDRLFADEEYRAFLGSIGFAPPLGSRISVVSELRSAPPVASATFNDWIDVLSVAAPVREPLAIVQRVLGAAVPPGTQFVPALKYEIPDLAAATTAPFARRDTVDEIPEGVALINAPKVWKAGHRGGGIRVAVVDTGVGPHDDLPDAKAGQSFVPGTGGDYHDGHGHGTYIAGVILARQNGHDVAGVAPDADLVVARAARSGQECQDDWIANAITWAVDQGAPVINVCLGQDHESIPISRALAVAAAKLSVVCAATGNEADDHIWWPAADPRCIAVAATTLADNLCRISNRGDGLDIYGPGCDILSTRLGGGTVLGSGTSPATAHVSGVAALVLCAKPGLTPDQILTLLRRTAEPVRFDKSVGRVSADAALN